MGRELPSISPLSLIVVGVLLVILSFILEPKDAKWFVLPDLFGLSNAAVGLLSIGVLYMFIGMVCSHTVFRGQWRQRNALVVAIVAFPMLISVYWVVAQFTDLFGPISSIENFFSEAFTYLPIALGLPLAFAADGRERLALVGVAGVSVSVPFLLILPETLESGDFVAFFPIAIILVLIFDGVLAYPLYRLGKAADTAE